MDLFGEATGVGVTLGLLGLTYFFLRRLTRLNGRFSLRSSSSLGQLQTLEQLRLSPTHTLHLVRIGDTQVVLAAYPAGCVVIDSIPANRVARPVVTS